MAIFRTTSPKSCPTPLKPFCITAMANEMLLKAARIDTSYLAEVEQQLQNAARPTGCWGWGCAAQRRLPRPLADGLQALIEQMVTAPVSLLRLPLHCAACARRRAMPRQHATNGLRALDAGSCTVPCPAAGTAITAGRRCTAVSVVPQCLPT